MRCDDQRALYLPGRRFHSGPRYDSPGTFTNVNRRAIRPCTSRPNMGRPIPFFQAVLQPKCVAAFHVHNMRRPSGQSMHSLLQDIGMEK